MISFCTVPFYATHILSVWLEVCSWPTSSCRLDLGGWASGGVLCSHEPWACANLCLSGPQKNSSNHGICRKITDGPLSTTFPPSRRSKTTSSWLLWIRCCMQGQWTSSAQGASSSRKSRSHRKGSGKFWGGGGQHVVLGTTHSRKKQCAGMPRQCRPPLPRSPKRVVGPETERPHSCKRLNQPFSFQRVIVWVAGSFCKLL